MDSGFCICGERRDNRHVTSLFSGIVDETTELLQ